MLYPILLHPSEHIITYEEGLGIPAAADTRCRPASYHVEMLVVRNFGLEEIWQFLTVSIGSHPGCSSLGLHMCSDTARH